MKICIVGSGISGLSAAHYLTDHPGHSVTVLEGADQFGGRANVTADGEHCTRLFLPDYHYLLGLFREIPAGHGSVLDSLRKCRRFASRADGTWVEIDHIYAFLSRTRGLAARDKLSIARSNWQAILVARRSTQSTNVFGSIWNWSATSLWRAMASARRERTSYALPGSTDRCLIDPWIDFLHSRGVELRSGCPVETVSPDVEGVRVVTASKWERFDAVIFTGFVHDAYSLLDRSAIARPLDCRRHTHCKAFTIDLDPREDVLASGDVRIYAGAGVTTVVQPEENRCVTLAAFPKSTQDEFILRQVCGQLGLRHAPLRVRARANLSPAEAVFVGEYVNPLRLEEPLHHRVYFAGSYTDNTYPLDSAEGACRSAFAAVSRLSMDHGGLTVRSSLGLPPAARPLRAPVAGHRAHPNTPTHGGLDRTLQALSTRLAALLASPVAEIVFDDRSGRTWPLPGPAIYVANHRSVFDVPAGALTFRQLKVLPRYIIARKYFEKGALGKILHAAGALPAVRGSDATVNAGVAAICGGDSIAMMPEGRITAPEEAAAAEFGRGAAMIAIATGAPIVPIGAAGTDSVWPTARPWPLVRRNRRRVTVRIGPPIDPAGLTWQELTEQVRAAVRHLEGHAEHTDPAPAYRATA